MLRLSESLGLLDKPASECVKTDEFLRTHRGFLRGRGCPCARRPGDVEMEADVYRRWYELREKTAEGIIKLCDGCGKLDVEGKHHPDAM